MIDRKAKKSRISNSCMQHTAIDDKTVEILEYVSSVRFDGENGKSRYDEPKG